MNQIPKIGDVIAFDIDGCYGRIASTQKHWRSLARAEQTLYTVRYFDPKTGKLVVCPDSRCAGHVRDLLAQPVAR